MSVISTAGYSILLEKIKKHIATCECCREALKSDNNNEAGNQPAPNTARAEDNRHIQPTKLGSECYNG